MIHGHGLFAKNGLACLARFDGPFCVLWVGRRHVQGVNIGIVDKVLVRAVGGYPGVVACKRFRARLGAATDGNEFPSCRSDHRIAKGIGYSTGGENAPTRWHGCVILVSAR